MGQFYLSIEIKLILHTDLPNFNIILLRINNYGTYTVDKF